MMLIGLAFPFGTVSAEPAVALQVTNQNGETVGFSIDDLTAIWQEEGSRTYTYSTYNTNPSYETEEWYGPSVRAILAAANIDVDSLADNDRIVFTAYDEYNAKITVKDFTEKRYYFPNGQSPNDVHFRGTTANQLKGKVEVPFIISIKKGANDLRNVFGQRDPQEQQKPDICQNLFEITIQKANSPTYNGDTPSIPNGSKVSEGDRLFFDLSTSPWQGGSQRYAWVYYTVSTDGTEPADPTFSDILYNYKQYGKPKYQDHPELFNYYEFTDARTTIIKYIVYIRGYNEPVVRTLRYTNASAPEPTYEFTSSKGTALKAGETTTLTATVTNGTGNLQYKFIVYNKDTDQWFRIKDFGQENTVEWYTGGAGNKVLYADVKDSTGAMKRLELPVTVSNDTTAPLAVKSFTSSKGSSLTENTNTTLTATATGGKSPYTYKFIVYNTQTKGWYKIRDFASSNSCDWYTGVAGNKVLYVDVKDNAGTVVRKELNVTVSKNASVPLAASYFTSSKGNTLSSGDTTTLSAKATGGSGSGYQYKFIVYNPQTNQWYKIQDYSTKSSVAWYTGAAGKKVLYVDIKDSAGNYVRTPLNVTVK